MGPEHLIKYVSAAHTRICFSSVSPLQEAAAVGFEEADKNGFWDKSRAEMKGKVERFCEVFDELGIPVSRQSIVSVTASSHEVLIITPHSPISLSSSSPHPSVFPTQLTPPSPTTVHNPPRRLLRPRQPLLHHPPPHLPLPGAHPLPPARLPPRLLPDHGARRRGHPTHRILHGGQ